MTEVEKAYAAGFFDGEGCVLIDLPRRTKGYALRVTLAQGSKTVLLRLQAAWGGSLSGKEGRWRLSLVGTTAGAFLSDIFPFLVVKREQAAIAIEFQGCKCAGQRTTTDWISIGDGYRKRLFQNRKAPPSYLRREPGRL
jgi:hypothetical protein